MPDWDEIYADMSRTPARPPASAIAGPVAPVAVSSALQPKKAHTSTMSVVSNSSTFTFGQQEELIRLYGEAKRLGKQMAGTKQKIDKHEAGAIHYRGEYEETSRKREIALDGIDSILAMLGDKPPG